MASNYSVYDQAADLGIHRVHSLVLGDAKKEARAARFAPPQFRRPAIGKGDVRHQEQQYEWETRMELEKIARRHNLKADDPAPHHGSTLTDKIAAWGKLKVENAIARPDGLGTGNAHRGGPNYRPIATFGQPRRTLPMRPIRNGPGSSTFANRRHIPPAPAGSVAAAWQAAAQGKTFQPFVLGGHSVASPGIVRARSPIRTPARRSIVGSPRKRNTSPVIEYTNKHNSPTKLGRGDKQMAMNISLPPPFVRQSRLENNSATSNFHGRETYTDQMSISNSKATIVATPGVEMAPILEPRKGFTYADQMDSSTSKSTVEIPQTTNLSSNPEHRSGTTYADIMDSMKSKIQSDHAPPKLDAMISPKECAPKPVIPTSQKLEASQWSNLNWTYSKKDGIRWSGKLADASDPYFQNPPVSPISISQAAITLAPILETSLDEVKAPPEMSASADSTQPTESVPNTPASITTSAALGEIDEYLDLLDEEEDEEDYKIDPDKLKREFEINERVNRSLAEAEEAALVREILSPRASPERKAVQFASRPTSPTILVEDDSVEPVCTKLVYVWNTFRDFVTARSVTGFEEYVLEPRLMREVVQSVAAASEASTETTGVETKPVDNELKEVTQNKDSQTADEMTAESVPTPITVTAAVASEATVPLVTPTITVTASIPESISIPPAAKEAPFPQEHGWDNVPAPTAVETKSAISPSEVIAPATNKDSNPSVYKVVRGKVVKEPVEAAPVAQPKSELESPTYKGRYPPTDVLKHVEPAVVGNTWDMPSTPSVKVDMEKYQYPKRVQIEDPFLRGLTAQKVENHPTNENRTQKSVPKKVVVTEPTKTETLIDYKPAAIPTASATDLKPSFVPLTAPSTSQDFKLVDLEVKEELQSIPETPTSSVPIVASSVTSPPATSAQRLGMPVPVPEPPIQRPALKTPIKPTVGPKPSTLAAAKAKSSLNSVVGGAIDPFLNALQPTAKKATPVSRPITPAISNDSVDSSPERSSPPKAKGFSIHVPPTTSLKESAPVSPTPSFDSEWTKIDSSKSNYSSISKNNFPAAPPSTPTQPSVRRTWFGTDTKIVSTPSATPTPAASPAIKPTIPARQSIPPSTTSSKAPEDPKPSSSKSSVPPNGRKLFTFELKVGQSIVSTPVHELDNPRAVAEKFAIQHDLENRLPGGKGMVEKIVGYFETQFIDRKSEREKRRAERRERERLKNSAEQQKSLV